jgi:hypothetical protein
MLEKGELVPEKIYFYLIYFFSNFVKQRIRQIYQIFGCKVQVAGDRRPVTGDRQKKENVKQSQNNFHHLPSEEEDQGRGKVVRD